MKGTVQAVTEWMKKNGYWFFVDRKKYFDYGPPAFAVGDEIEFAVSTKSIISDTPQALNIKLLSQGEHVAAQDVPVGAPQDANERILRCVALEQAVRFTAVWNDTFGSDEKMEWKVVLRVADDFLAWLKKSAGGSE